DAVAAISECIPSRPRQHPRSARLPIDRGKKRSSVAEYGFHDGAFCGSRLPLRARPQEKSPMIRPGLCSVTFRALEVPTVVRLAAEAGLERIEWAGDVHVPPGDLVAARRARELTEQAGLSVASHGSYLRFEGADEEVRAEGEAVLAAARELGAPRIRVWAGSADSADVPSPERAHIVRRLQEFADLAGA